jgi:hypothetical protein
MNLVLYSILKLLSRPVVCTNFSESGDKYFSASALNQGHRRAIRQYRNLSKYDLVRLTVPEHVPELVLGCHRPVKCRLLGSAHCRPELGMP